MKNEKTLTTEVALYGLIFLAALALRLISLGAPLLLEREASWALQAWQLARGETITVGSQVGYLSFTKGLFSLFGPGNFMARVWPAFAGSLIIWLPFLLREELKRIPALVLAGGLALDPALVPVSRISGDPMPALVFLVLALGMFHSKRIPLFIFLTGLGLFSGPGFWLGLFFLGLGLLVIGLLGLIDVQAYFRERMEYFKVKPETWLAGILPSLLALFIIGSFFLRNFQGVSAWAGALPEFVLSWRSSGGLGVRTLITYFLLNNPLILLFGFLGLADAWRKDNRLGQVLSIWFVCTVAGLVIYPDRQAADLIWLTIPLWIAAAVEIVRLLSLARSTWVTWTLAGLVVVLMSLNWLTFTGMIFQGGNENALLLELGLLVASLALLILTGVIVSSEWGWHLAWKGLVGGTLSVLVLYLVASLFLDAYILDKDPRSMFSGRASGGQMELLVDSIADISLTVNGRPDAVRGAVIDASDALRWALREFEEMDYRLSLPAGIDYPLLITKAEYINPEIEVNYRGQDFVLSARPNWGRVLPDDWISWIAFREGPLTKEYLILWVRNDIYSGY